MINPHSIMVKTLSPSRRTIRCFFGGEISNNHDYCVVDEVTELMEKGYTCYLEYEIPIGPSETKRGPSQHGQGYRAVVDIYAVKEKQEIIVEVGTLSVAHGDRIALLKKLKPNAKIIHVHQWKNYGINEDLIWRLHIDWKRRIAWDKYVESGQLLKDIERMGETLPKRC